MADALLEANLVTSEAKDKAMLPINIEYQKASKLVSCVGDTIKCKPGMIHKFIQILRESNEKALVDAAQNLESKLLERKLIKKVQLSQAREGYQGK